MSICVKSQPISRLPTAHYRELFTRHHCVSIWHDGHHSTCPDGVLSICAHNTERRAAQSRLWKTSIVIFPCIPHQFKPYCVSIFRIITEAMFLNISKRVDSLTCEEFSSYFIANPRQLTITGTSCTLFQTKLMCYILARSLSYLSQLYSRDKLNVLHASSLDG